MDTPGFDPARMVELTADAIRIIANTYYAFLPQPGAVLPRYFNAEGFARELLSRLAQNDPPIVIAYSSELKDK